MNGIIFQSSIVSEPFTREERSLSNKDELMPVRSITASPSQMAELELSFRRAWHDVNVLRSLDTSREVEHREWLAQIILALATTRPREDLVDLAVRQFIATVPAA